MLWFLAPDFFIAAAENLGQVLPSFEMQITEPLNQPVIEDKALIRHDFQPPQAPKIANPPPAPVMRDVLVEVPFVVQAPLGNWKDPRQQNGCEEASVLMAMLWVTGERMTPKEAEAKIIAISEFEQKNYGHYHDTSAEDTADIMFRQYFEYEKVDVKYRITTEDIKKELIKGNIAIVPVNGQVLKNPFYNPPGPLEHMLVVIGYDTKTKEFITNDPGTKRGEKFRYPETILGKALRDYPTGFHLPIKDQITAMIVVRR